MDGIHDLGGMDGFGPVRRRPDAGPFHAPWEARVLALGNLVVGLGLANVDAFRHAIERLDPVTYLTAGYWGRWLAALEGLVAAPAPTSTPVAGARRTVARAPRFAVGDTVRARDMHPRGRTRLPRYVRGHVGRVVAQRGAWVFPDTHAHGGGECPEYVYGVRFAGDVLWAGSAEPGVAVHVDCFEPYLEPA